MQGKLHAFHIADVGAGNIDAHCVAGSGDGREGVVAEATESIEREVRALKQLVEPSSTAAVLAPRRDRNSPWEPMLARYDVARVLDTLDRALRDGLRSFQGLFERLDVQPLELTPEIELALADWDTPADVGA